MNYLQKNGSRIYKIGTKPVELEKSILDKILEWSTPPNDVSQRLDKNIVAALLIACVGVEKVSTGQIEQDVMGFLYSKTHSTFIYLNIIFKIIFFFFYRTHGRSLQIGLNAYDSSQIKRRPLSHTIYECQQTRMKKKFE